jgi:phosphopantetheinyl transferase
MSLAPAPVEAGHALWPVVNVVYVMLDRYEDAPGDTIAYLVSHLSSLVPPVRAKRSKNLRQPIDRLAYLTAGALINIAAAPFTHRSAVPITAGTNGKPDFADGSGMHFNLSHCRKAVCCAVSRQPVGIDVEGLVDPYEDLATTCLTDTELAYLGGYPCRAKRISVFTRLWTRKEALGKYLGCGLDESVLQADTLHWPAGAASILATRHTDDTRESAPWIRTFGLQNIYISVCGHGKVHLTSRSLDEVLAASTPDTCNPLREHE